MNIFTETVNSHPVFAALSPETRETIAKNAPDAPNVTTNKWWSEINELALIDAARKFIRVEGQEAGERFNSHLIGSCRAIGMPEEAIRAAINSDRNLTIYEP